MARGRRFFNTTGPCYPERHYMLPPKERLIGANLDRYIRDQLYWVLHAPRQTGKTTFLQSWMRELNASGEVVACYVSVERCQDLPETERAIPNLVESISQWARRNEVPIPPSTLSSPPESALNLQMSLWAALCAPKPLVVLFDEVDVLRDAAMVSFLRQLRDGFAGRGIGKFPISIALVGMRDLRDYLMKSKDGAPLNPGSPFNIKKDSVSLGNFSRQDIARLTMQHTEETGQRFSEEALDRLWALTSGQPWLVNAICDRIVSGILPEDSTETVTAEHVEEAKEFLIASRATHIDALAVRLREDRVRRVVQPILIGETDPTLAEGDDFQFCQDLGLVDLQNGTPVIANAIYREVLARVLSYGMQIAIPAPEFAWKKPDGTLDIDALLKAFQKFWRRHADLWEAKADYTEAFPHLLLMAFLQRVVNGGGRIEREYAAGRGRVDIGIEFAGRVHVIEIKLVHDYDGREGTKEEGLEQTVRYAKTVGADTRHLVIFDRRPEWRTKSWDERLGWEEATAADGTPVIVVWC